VVPKPPATSATSSDPAGGLNDAVVVVPVPEPETTAGVVVSSAIGAVNKDVSTVIHDGRNIHGRRCTALLLLLPGISQPLTAAVILQHCE
jgi:hypothetical protein